MQHSNNRNKEKFNKRVRRSKRRYESARFRREQRDSKEFNDYNEATINNTNED